MSATSRETDYVRQIRALAETAGVRMSGYRDHPLVLEAMIRAAIVIVPSRWNEPFGLTALEAIACGLPVITTHGTPWEALPAHRCGWWVANDPAALAAALREAMVLDDEARRAMGARGRALVEQKFGWPGVAEQMLAVYQWMLGRGPRPPCVIS